MRDALRDKSDSDRVASAFVSQHSFSLSSGTSLDSDPASVHQSVFPGHMKLQLRHTDVEGARDKSEHTGQSAYGQGCGATILLPFPHSAHYFSFLSMNCPSISSVNPMQLRIMALGHSKMSPI